LQLRRKSLPERSITNIHISRPFRTKRMPSTCTLHGSNHRCVKQEEQINHNSATLV
jgi:hypothetical protein